MARQHEALRARVDAAYEELDAKLTDAYYTFWKYGLRADFYGWNVLPTKELSQRQHARLQELIWSLYVLALVKVNKVEKHYPDEKIEKPEGPDGRDIVREARAVVARFGGGKGIAEIKQDMAKVLKRTTGRDVEID